MISQKDVLYLGHPTGAVSLSVSPVIKRMSDVTPDDLAAVGRALYGQRWQTPLSEDLHISDRTMRRWLAGESAIPPAIVTELRTALVERLKTIGGLVRFTVNPRDKTIFHSATNAAFKYDELGAVKVLHPGFASSEEVPLIAEGAKEALRQECERHPSVNGMWIDPTTGRPVGPRLHGFMRGSVVIPPDVDLTAPIIDQPFSVEKGEIV